MNLLRIFFFPLIWPATLLYRGVLYLHKATTPSVRVEVPVISVGNITTGGTGKTPAVLKILDTLDSPLKPAVISRGYGRSSEGMRIVDSKNFKDFGDEPVLIKKKHPEVEVIVGADRLKCARFAQEQGQEVIILDDGFQSWELKRDRDIVMIDCSYPFGGGYLLPFGRLREPVKALSRADSVILNRCQLISGEEIE
jgi:tetraacyldisaccharide 4'-kinase